MDHGISLLYSLERSHIFGQLQTEVESDLSLDTKACVNYFLITNVYRSIPGERVTENFDVPFKAILNKEDSTELN